MKAKKNGNGIRKDFWKKKTVGLMMCWIEWQSGVGGVGTKKRSNRSVVCDLNEREEEEVVDNEKKTVQDG